MAMALLNAADPTTTAATGERAGPRPGWPEAPASLPRGPVAALSAGVFADGRIGQQVRVPKTAELVAAHLRRQIVRGELVEGDALPPEAVLMEQFGVSRPTLREAFRVLESEALISVRRGAHGGARVHTPNGDVAARYAGLVLEYRGTTLADVYEARAMLEPPCVGLLATRRTDTDLARLRAALAAADTADPDSARGASAQFHALVVELGGNQTVTVLAGMLRHIIDLTQDGQIFGEGQPPASDDLGADSVRAHRRILEAIEAGDALATEELWRRHLDELGAGLDEQPTPRDLMGG
jgi:GntR family transcriptional regulator, transcriptional repressor for pyruvate dehydrogenase complex